MGYIMALWGNMVYYGVMFWEQLLEYLPKGTQNFPLMVPRKAV